jgi:hypothetical protein
MTTATEIVSKEHVAPATAPELALPSPVERWRHLATSRLPVPPTAIYLEGPARFRRGRLPYLPMRIRTWNRLGVERVSELEVGLMSITLMRGLDAFVDGRGFTRVGSELSIGPEVDQGAFHVMFLETLLVPAAWPADIRWETVHSGAARVVMPFRSGTEQADLEFDPNTGLPTSYTADRYKRPGGPKVQWTVSLASWRAFGVLDYPTDFVVRWSDEPLPWLRMRISAVVLDPAIAEPMARARAVLSSAPNEF